MKACAPLLALAATLAPTAIACGDGAVVDAAPVVLGPPRYHVSVEADGRRLVLARANEPLLVLGADAFQVGVVEALDESKSYDPFTMDGREGEAGVTFRTAVGFRASAVAGDPSRATVDLDYGDGLGAHLTVHDEGDAGFTIDLAPFAAGGTAPDIAVLRIVGHTSGDPHEGFYGLGEWEDSVDHRGKLRSMQIEADLDLESATNEAHVPVPFLLGTHGWAIFAESKRTGAFDVARKDPTAIELSFAVASRNGTAGAPESLRVWLFGADAPIDLVKGCYRASGQARVPPPWALGPWIWRDENRDQAEVLEDLATIRRLDLATSGIWLDHPYATWVNSFDFDPARYTDPRALIDRAHAAGMRFALWSTPYIEAGAKALRAEAEQSHYFPPQAGIPLNDWSQPIDFTNGAAFGFWRGLVKRYTDLGVEGFKLDYGEDVAPSIGLVRNVFRFADGSDERTMHHGYSGIYHRAYADELPEDRFLLCRAAHWGEQSTGCIIWPGDVDATFTRHRERFTPREGGKEATGVGGLPATVVMGLSLGVSGFPFFGADTGGYRHSPPDEELFVRWVQQTALSSVMQVGDSSSQPPWGFTPENGRTMADVDIYRTYARLHMRLFPYEWTYAQRIKIDGRPIQRPLGLVHPELGIHPSDVYYFGDDLLVAPVLTRGERTRSFVAPAGTWIDWWDGSAHDSDGKTPLAIDAPLTKLPLLLRDGAVVPLLRPTIDTLASAVDADVESFVRDPGLLWARVAPGRPRRFDAWDGSSIERTSATAIRVAPGTTFTRGFVIEMMATARPADVLYEEEATGARSTLAPAASLAALESATQGWAWEEAGRGTLWLKLPAHAARATIR